MLMKTCFLSEYSEARKFSIVQKNLPTIREHEVLVCEDPKSGHFDV